MCIRDSSTDDGKEDLCTQKKSYHFESSYKYGNKRVSNRQQFNTILNRNERSMQRIGVSMLPFEYIPVCCSCWIRQLLSTAFVIFSTALLSNVAKLAGASSRNERISDAGINVNTSWILSTFSVQNWSQKVSSSESIGFCSSKQCETMKHLLKYSFDQYVYAYSRQR